MGILNINNIAGITKFTILGGYLQTAVDYFARVLADSGLIVSKNATNDLYNSLPQQSSIQFGWVGVAGSKKRTSTVWSWFTKLYSMFTTNDATQTTESLQPYVAGNIAPNENEGLKNVNGDARYMTNPEISFADDEAWSVTLCMNWAGKSISGYETILCDTNNGDGTSITLRWGSSNNITLRNNSGSVYSFNSNTLGYSGKFRIISIVADGAGNASFYEDGVFIETKSVVSNIILGKMLCSTTNTYNFYGQLPAHIIHSTALTPTQVTEVYDLLSPYYPEIPSVDIGTDTIASSNLEVVASSDGTVITEAADNTDWATGASRWCYHNDDLPTGAIYGKLYNKAARDVIIANPPSGWHVATEAELTALALNGGNALKMSGTNYFNTTGGTNSTGFTALGGVSRNADGTFNTLKDEACFWCADSDKVMKVYHNNDTAEVIAVTSVNEGFSIRLVKD